ncbi:MAG: protein jag, partial [Candidatus Eiseniibacteriota bacterium]
APEMEPMGAPPDDANVFAREHGAPLAGMDFDDSQDRDEAFSPQARVEPSSPQPRVESNQAAARFEPDRPPSRIEHDAPPARGLDAAFSGPPMNTYETPAPAPFAGVPAAEDTENLGPVSDDLPQRTREFRGGPERRPFRDARRRDEAPRRAHPDTPGLSPDALAAEGRRCTEELLRAMGFEGKVSATASEDRVDVVAEVGADDELLNGAKGEVRQALQQLLNRMVNRGEGSRYHLQLEINDFWKRREEELEALARQLADRAVANQTEALTEYLNAQERRIIHVALREDTRVKTYALGDGMIKRLAVAPADFPEGGRSE